MLDQFADLRCRSSSSAYLHTSRVQEDNSIEQITSKWEHRPEGRGVPSWGNVNENLLSLH